MQWQNEKTLEDVQLRDENMPDTGFLSSASYIKKHKDDPQKRYEVAQKFLPWSLAFKESALALRALIRDKKKAKQCYENELSSLYKLAAWESFYPKHAQTLDESGFRVFEQIPGGKVANLNINFKQLGYEQLKLLTKTDAKLLIDLFGKPNQHTTLYELYHDEWLKAEQDYIDNQQKPISKMQDETSNLNTTTHIDNLLTSASIKILSDGSVVAGFSNHNSYQNSYKNFQTSKRSNNQSTRVSNSSTSREDMAVIQQFIYYIKKLVVNNKYLKKSAFNNSICEVKYLVVQHKSHCQVARKLFKPSSKAH